MSEEVKEKALMFAKTGLMDTSGKHSLFSLHEMMNILSYSML